MYNVYSQMIILEIPKCGSRSLVQAAVDRYGKRCIKHAGHKSIAEIMELGIPPGEGNPIPVIAVLRDPDERLVSQVSAYMKNKGVSKYKAMDEAARQSHVIFKPQLDFFNGQEQWAGAVELHGFPIEHIDLAVEKITGKYKVAPHKNIGQHRVTLAELEAMPQYNDVMIHYGRDYDMYNYYAQKYGVENA